MVCRTISIGPSKISRRTMTLASKRAATVKSSPDRTSLPSQTVAFKQSTTKLRANLDSLPTWNTKEKPNTIIPPRNTRPKQTIWIVKCIMKHHPFKFHRHNCIANVSTVWIVCIQINKIVIWITETNFGQVFFSIVFSWWSLKVFKLKNQLLQSILQLFQLTCNT